jgi:hypothetical protein
MGVATAFRQVHVNGRIADAMGGLPKPWRRRRIRRVRRLLWVVGLAFGTLMVFGLLWSLIAAVRDFDGS